MWPWPCPCRRSFSRNRQCRSTGACLASGASGASGAPRPASSRWPAPYRQPALSRSRRSRSAAPPDASSASWWSRERRARWAAVNQQVVNPLREFVHVERFDHMAGKARLVRAFQVVRSPESGHCEGWD